MKTLLRTLLVGMVLVLVSETVSAVNVRGSRSCGLWVEQRDKEKRGDFILALASQSWLVGYLSGLTLGFNKEFWGGTKR